MTCLVYLLSFYYCKNLNIKKVKMNENKYLSTVHQYLQQIFWLVYNCFFLILVHNFSYYYPCLNQLKRNKGKYIIGKKYITDIHF